MGEALKKSAVDNYSKAADLIFEWWKDLQAPKKSGPRAALRRARNPDTVATHPEYFELFRNLSNSELPGYIKNRLSYRLPLVAGVLSHIREDEPGRSMAAKMGSSEKQGTDRPVVSDLRFRRLLRTEDDNEMYLMMIRMIRMLDNKANVKDAAISVFTWDEKTRKKWASRYYLKRDIYSDNIDKNDSENETKGELK